MSKPAAHRTARWISDLDATLTVAEDLVSRGEDQFRLDAALPLAFEALANRVGELSKRLIAADPQRFNDPIWAQAARTRDFVVHHYDRMDTAVLWATVSVSFPELRQLLRTLNT